MSQSLFSNRLSCQGEATSRRPSVHVDFELAALSPRYLLSTVQAVDEVDVCILWLDRYRSYRLSLSVRFVFAAPDDVSVVLPPAISGRVVDTLQKDANLSRKKALPPRPPPPSTSASTQRGSRVIRGHWMEGYIVRRVTEQKRGVSE